MALTFIRIEHSVSFNDMKAATREADTLRMNIKRYAEKHKIPCTAIIGISNTDLRNAEVVLIKKGKARPKRKVLSKIKRAGIPETIEPHLHVVIICKSGYTALANYLITKIQNRYKDSYPEWKSNDIELTENGGGNSSSDYYSIDNPLYYIKYVIKQSSSIRYVEDFTGEIDFDFKGQVRLNLPVINERTYFHKKMRKNYRKPVDKYHDWCMSKLKSNCNKFTYSEEDRKPTTLCAADTGNVFGGISPKDNDDGTYELIW